MSIKRTLITTAIATVVSIGLNGSAIAANKTGNMEKCYGISKAGQNDCGGRNNACAGQSKEDNDPMAWKLVPKGTCLKMNGKLTPSSQTADNKT
jgi:uncharacterized membrane protein